MTDRTPELWLQQLQDTVNHFGTWEANLLLGSDKMRSLGIFCKIYLARNNYNEVKINQLAQNLI